MKTIRLFTMTLFLSILIGACCHSQNQVRQNHHIPLGFVYVGYNPGYVYPSLSDFSETLHDVSYVEPRHHDCDSPETKEP